MKYHKPQYKQYAFDFQIFIVVRRSSFVIRRRRRCCCRRRRLALPRAEMFGTLQRPHGQVSLFLYVCISPRDCLC